MKLTDDQLRSYPEHDSGLTWEDLLDHVRAASDGRSWPYHADVGREALSLMLYGSKEPPRDHPDAIFVEGGSAEQVISAVARVTAERVVQGFAEMLGVHDAEKLESLVSHWVDPHPTLGKPEGIDPSELVQVVKNMPNRE